MLAVGVVRKVLVRENCKRQAEEIRVTEKKKPTSNPVFLISQKVINGALRRKKSSYISSFVL